MKTTLRTILIVFSSLAIIFSLSMLPVVASAQSNCGTQSNNSPTSYTVCNPLTNVNSICDFLVALYQDILYFGASIAMFFIVLAGFRFVAAQGNKDKLVEARRNFTNVLIGIGLLLGAVALTQLVAATVNAVYTSTGQTGPLTCTQSNI